MNVPDDGCDASIAVLIPCYNEAAAITEVVQDFRAALPDATIYVFDNNSNDDTATLARDAGAVVRSEPRQGKGNVVRRMFADIDADIYVMVDGDGTYDAPSARKLIEIMVADNVDMVVGSRVPIGADEGEVYRRGHTMGNRLFNTVARLMFGAGFTDIFSGYRAMSRRFVKSFPLTASGFEIETEITVHAVELASPYAELPTPYGSRRGESSSKLRTYRDGARILRIAIALYRDVRPMRFFGILFGLLLLCSILLGIPVVTDYIETGLVPKFPTAILAAAMATLAFIFLTCGIIVDSLSRARREVRKLAYLRFPPPGS